MINSAPVSVREARTGAAAYQCLSCRRVHDLATPLWRCPACQSPLAVNGVDGMSRADIDTKCRSLWRYRAALPWATGRANELGEGGTPLLAQRWDGLDVLCKLEFLNPTGSFKDRCASVTIEYLKSHGIDRVCGDSSGNGGASLAAFAAAAGIACRIVAPAGTSTGKLQQIAAYGAEVKLIDGPREAAAAAMQEEAKHAFYASHNWHAMAIQGTKTVGYELWEELGFRAPDNIVMPLGGGSNLLGCHLAFSELLGRGEIDRMPRLFGVQAANVAPIHASFLAGTGEPATTGIAPTIAEGAAIEKPVKLGSILAALADCNGATLAVCEHEIAAALRGLARRGLYVEPTSALAAAGLSQLIECGTVTDGQTTVLLLTGNGLKAPTAISEAMRDL